MSSRMSASAIAGSPSSTSAGGHQPMFNEDGSVVIVFNGEIYNFAELRPKLEALGHVFRSDHSDTETIIHAWESFGPDCLQHLTGQFAFALWDRNRGCLFLARDRMGKKPIYYATDPAGRFVFASELAALAQVPAPAPPHRSRRRRGFLRVRLRPRARPRSLPASTACRRRISCCWNAASRAAAAPLLGRADATVATDEAAAAERLLELLGDGDGEKTGRRRAARRVPVGRRRFLGRRGDGGEAAARSARHLHHRLRGRRGRNPVRGDGRRAATARASTTSAPPRST